MRVHIFDNFAWKHSHVNIHQIQVIDTLHQLYKGLVMKTVAWIQNVIVENHRLKKCGDPTQEHPKRKINQRMAAIPTFTGLKIFPNFLGVQQWAGREQKAMVR